MKLKNDSYRSKRGGTSRILDLSCRKCEQHITYYQKDGPGALRRLYIDRMTENQPIENQNLACPNCNELLGIYTIYKKENRPCIRLFVDSIAKKQVPKDSI